MFFLQYSNHVWLTCWPFFWYHLDLLDWLFACQKKHTHTTCAGGHAEGQVEIAVQPCNGFLLVLEMTGNLIALRAELDRSVSVKKRLPNHALRLSSNKSRIVVSKMSGHFGMKFDLIKPKIHKKLRWSYLKNIMARWFNPWPNFVPDPWRSPTSPFQGSFNL